MKYLFPAKQANWDVKLDERFGRASGFVLYNDEDDNLTFIENANQNEGHGVGIQAAQIAVNAGANVAVASGPIGPKATDVLTQAQIKIVSGVGEISLKEALEKAKA